MKTFKPFVLAVTVGALPLAQTASAQIIFSHSGTADPTTEGWTLFQSGTGQNAGPINEGAPAWQVEDYSNDGFTYYAITPSAATVNAALSQGWTLTARVRLPQISDGNAGGSPGLAFMTDNRLFAMHLGTELNGDPLIYLPGSGFYFTDLDTGFHTYQFTYNPQSQSASFSIDGVERVGVYEGQAGSFTPALWFGARSLTDTGVGQFNSVQMTVVPEPEAYAAVAGLALVALAVARRFRKPAQANA
jgi:hypothetical protein